MNLQKTENFIFMHKTAVCIVLLAVMLCCLAVSAASDYLNKTVPASAGINYTIKDESGKNGYAALGSQKDAMDFGRICINNCCPYTGSASFYISENANGGYNVYRDGADMKFDRCYTLYPCAVIDRSGNVRVNIHKKF